MEVPKEMSLKHKTYFATFTMGGASYRAFRNEHHRIFKKDVSRSTYARIKRDAKKILDTVTHRVTHTFLRISRILKKCVNLSSVNL